MLFHRAGASMMRCRGGACPSRRRTYSPYKPPSKWQTLPICHCEEANGRRGALSAKREEVPLGCNLGRALPSRTGCRKNVQTECVCSGAHCAAVGGFAALRMRRPLYGE